MTYIITAHTNDKALLIVSETRTDSSDVLNLVKILYVNQGYIVSVKEKY